MYCCSGSDPMTSLMNGGDVAGRTCSFKVELKNKRKQIFFRLPEVLSNVFDLAHAPQISECGWTGLGYTPSRPLIMCVCSHSHDF